MAAPHRRMRGLGFALGWLMLAGIAAAQAQDKVKVQDPGPIRFPDTSYEPVEFSELDGWAGDDHAVAFATFRTSCAPIVRRPPTAPEARPVAAALEKICRGAVAMATLDAAGARTFFEENFRPIRITRLGSPQGFLTGYYEPIVEGSRFPTREFTVPMYRRPDDLVSPNERKGEGFPNKGPVGRRAADGTLVPYFDRGEIEDGALDGRRLEICWLKDPIAAFSIHIQGSARVRLEDGLILRLNYAAHNGHPYTPVGRILIERNLVPREEITLERIRQWMLDHPDETRELRRKNQSFVFFRVSGLGDENEPVGGQGVRLTPGRSIAVDRPLHVYGTPFFIEADLPIASSAPVTPFRRLMIAQDTGSAITGPARADIYFGAGDQAGRVAGRVRHPGHFAMLIPREIDPVAAGARAPLPRPQPTVEAASGPDHKVSAKHRPKRHAKSASRVRSRR